MPVDSRLRFRAEAREKVLHGATALADAVRRKPVTELCQQRKGRGNYAMLSAMIADSSRRRPNADCIRAFSIP